MPGFLRKICIFVVMFAACFAGVRIYAEGNMGQSGTTYILDDQGAKIPSVPSSFVYGNVSRLSSLPYKPGYGYAGHYTGQNCTGTMVIDYRGYIQGSVRSTTLYACWRTVMSKPIVVLDDDGGSGGAFATSCGTDVTVIFVNNENVSLGHRGDWAYGDIVRSGAYWWMVPCNTGNYAVNTMAQVPTRQGYNFLGYYTGQNGTGTKVVEQNGDMVDAALLYDTLQALGSEPITIYAKWQQTGGGINLPQWVTVNISDSGATTNSQYSVLYLNLNDAVQNCNGYRTTQSCNSAVVTSFTAPTKTGYTYGGHYTGTNGSGNQWAQPQSNATQGQIRYSVVQNTSVYANWIPNIYSVTLNHQSATNSPSPSTVYLKYGEGWYSNQGATTPIYNMVTVPVRTDYDFAGYWTGTNGNGYQVVDANGAFLYTPEALGAITSNNTPVYAYWVPAATESWITVTINDNGATVPSKYNGETLTTLYRNTNSNVPNCDGYKLSQSCSATTVTQFTPPQKTDFVYTGHTVNGSNTQFSNSSGGNLAMLNSNATVTASWTSNSGTVSTIVLNNNDGQQQIGAQIYTLYNVGWFSDRGITNPITVSIFDAVANGGAGLTPPTNGNLVFNGYWSLDNGGVQIIDAMGNILVANPTYTGRTALYAHWDGVQSTVTLNPNGGTACAVTQVNAVYGSAMPTLSCAPSRQGYSFSGYYDSTSGGTSYYSNNLTSTHVWDKTGAQTLYAQWYPRKYNVNYYCTSGGSAAYIDSAIYDQAYVVKTNDVVGCSVPNGQTLVGWDFTDWGVLRPGNVVTYRLPEDARAVVQYENIVTVTLDHGNPDNNPEPDTVYYVFDQGWYLDSDLVHEIRSISNVPVKYGYTFLGYWNAQSGGVQAIGADGSFTMTDVQMNAQNTLYARYSPNTYTVTLNDQSATVASSPNPVYYNPSTGWSNGTNTISGVTPPQKNGYYFDGFWVDLGTALNPVGSGTRITDSNGNFVTVTPAILQGFHEGLITSIDANWLAQNIVTFSCQNQSGDGLGTPAAGTTVQIHNGETLTFPAFTGCSWVNNGMSPYRWGHVSNGGFDVTYSPNESITWNSGWGNRTFNVWYAPNYFNYEYSCGTGSGTPPSAGNTYYHDPSWTTAENTCTKPGYSFTGWLEPVSNVLYAESTVPSNANFSGWLWDYNVTGAAGGEFTAQWQANTYTIAYVLNGGTAGASAPTSGTYDSVLNINNPTHAHGTFAGWNISGMTYGTTHYYGNTNPPTSTTSATSLNTDAVYFKNLRAASGTVTFTATWTCDNGYSGDSCEPNMYNLTWNCGVDGDGNPVAGTPPTNPSAATFGQSVTFPAQSGSNWNCPAPTGYRFTGWTIDANAGAGVIPAGTNYTWNLATGSTMYAHYVKNTFNITYVANGGGATGTTPSPTSCTYGETCNAPAGTVYTAPTGHHFGGWACTVGGGSCGTISAGGDLSTVTATNNATVTLTAQWTPNTYTITYYDYDESGHPQITGASTVSYTYGTGATINYVPSKLHSVFDKWCDADGTNCATTRTILPTDNGDKSFYAKFNCVTGYEKYNRTMPMMGEYSTGEETRYPAGSCAPASITLTCNAHGGVVCLEQFPVNNRTYKFGLFYDTFIAAEGEFNQLSVHGHPFAVTEDNDPDAVNWFGQSGLPIQSFLYSSSFIPNGDTLLRANPNATFSDWMDALATQRGTTWGREHYTFDGLWTTADNTGIEYIAPDTPLRNIVIGGNSSDSALATTFTSDATIHAHWIPDVYMISLEANGGLPGTLSAVYEEYDSGWSRSSLGPFGAWSQITVNELPTRQGYTFVGYYDTSAATGGTKYIEADGTLANGITPASFGQETLLYARWANVTFNVQYVANGGGGTGPTPNPATCTYGGICNAASANAYSAPTGQRFNGWACTIGGNSCGTIAAGGDISTITMTNNATVTLTAQWTNETYTITYLDEDGTTVLSGISPTSYTYPNGVTLGTPSSAMANERHATFAGWCDTNGNNCGYTSVSANSTGNKTFRASWTPNTYLITLNDNTNGGSGGSGIIKEIYGDKWTSYDGTQITNVTIPTKLNSVFEGYYDNYTNSGVLKIPATGSLANVSATTFDNDVTLYAHFAECVCTAGTGVDTCSISVSNNTCSANAQCLPGFSNLNVTCDGTSCTSSCTANSITLNWNENGGTALTNGSCTYGGNLALPGGPSYADHTFNGWKLADNSYSSASSVIMGGCNSNNTGVTSGTSTAIQAQWCDDCVVPSHGSCVLDATTTLGTCTYTTSCESGYTISGNGTATPTCTAECYEVTLNPNGGTAGSITKLYKKRDNTTLYTNSTCTTEYTTTNDIVPLRTDYTFRGFHVTQYNSVNSDDAAKADQVLGTDGAATTYNSNWTITDNTTVYAAWAEDCPSSVSNGTCGLTVTTAGAVDYNTSCSTGYTMGGADTAAPTCTANCNAITLDSNGGTSGSRTVLYKLTGSPAVWYIDNTCETQYTSSHYSSIKPLYNGYTLRGFYTSQLSPITAGTSGPTRYIMHTGAITTSGNDWDINAPAVLYAAWATNCVTPIANGSCSISISGNTTTYNTVCDDGYTISGNNTYNPTCNANSITINWDENGGSALSNGNCTYGGNLGLVAAPNYADHTFNGWKLADASYAAASTVIVSGCNSNNTGVTSGTSTAIQAQWCDDCVVPSHGSCVLDATTTPGTCTYTTSCESGYTISGNGTATPTCSANGYTVTYKKGSGGTGSDVVQDVEFNSNFTTRDGTQFTKTNSVVTSWNTVSGGSYPNLNTEYPYSTAGDTVLAANWGTCSCTPGTHVDTCSVTGVTDNKCQYSYSCASGYNNGGATSGTFEGTAGVAANNSPNCASGNTYTISYVLNGGHYGTNHPVTAIYGTAFTIDNPTHDHATFTGWNITGMDGVTHYYGANGTTTQNHIDGTMETVFKNLHSTGGTVTFTATWDCYSGYTGTNCGLDLYTVTYYCGAGATGNPPADDTVLYGSTPTLPSTQGTCAKVGYDLDGWRANGESTNWTNGTQWTYTTDKTFTAQWTPKAYTIQYRCSDGSDTNPTSGWTFGGTAPTATNPVSYNQNVTMAADPYSDQSGCRKVYGTPGNADYCDNCYTFGGWTIDAESVALADPDLVHTANSTVSWGSTYGTNWCIVDNSPAACQSFIGSSTFAVKAQYTPKQYDITYMYATSPSNPNASMPANYTYSVGTPITNADQTAPAHATFNGWCTDLNDATTCVTAGQPITIGNRDHGDRTYYAKWSCENGYSLSYNANNEPVCTADTISCGPGFYLESDTATCEPCTQNYYCAGGEFTFNGADQGIVQCPTPADHKRTTFPSNYYTFVAWVRTGYANSAPTSSGGYSAITQCKALNWINFNRGRLYEYVKYNTTSEKYDVSTNSWGWSDVNPGYYLTTKADCGSYAYYHDAFECVAGGYCPGKTHVTCNSSNQATVHTTTFGLNVCGDDSYSNGGASATSCTACNTDNGYGNTGDEFEDHAYVSSCKTTCSAGQCVRTAGAACVNVGAGGWATGGVVSQGETLTCGACPVGTTTIGFGYGADEANDCGRVLHVGENLVYLRGNRKTDRTLNVKIGNDTYYGNMCPVDINMSDGINHYLKIKLGNTVYSVYDDSAADNCVVPGA